jgi:DNA-binding YbaB/EbfC family protein
MSKRKMGGMPPAGGGNMGGMMKQLQKMQEDMVKAQEALANETVEVSVGGGALTIVITGHQRIQSIKINKDLIDTSEADWVADLEDLLVVATNQAIEQSQTMAAERMEAITGNMGGLGGLGGLFG